MKSDEVVEKVYAKILNFLSFHQRSNKEVSDRLDQYLYKFKKLSDEDRTEIKSRLLALISQQNYLNDEEYARTFIRQKTTSNKPSSPKAIMQFLYKKGVSREIIEKVLPEYTQENEELAVLKMAEKKFKSYQKYEPRVARQKLIAYLFSKGYSSDVIYAVVDTKFNLN